MCGSDPVLTSGGVTRAFVVLAIVAAFDVSAFRVSAMAAEVRVASAILAPLHSCEAPAAEAGVLLSLDVREGDEVAAGEVIGAVDARRERLQADIARVDLAMARREAESDIRVRLAEKVRGVARAELARSTSVNADFPNTVSAKEIDRLRLSVEQATLEIEHAAFEQSLLALKIARIEADLRLAEHNVERLQIASPIAGVVAKVNRHAGEWVAQGEAVVRLVRVDRLKLEGYLPIEQAASTLVGRPVRVVATLGPGEPIEATGRVTFISPEAEPVNAQVLFQAEIDNTERRLRPGLTVSTVVIGERAAATVSAAAASADNDTPRHSTTFEPANAEPSPR